MSVAASILCKLVNALPVFSISAGIYTMVVISVERVRCVLPARGQQSPAPDARSLGVRGTVIALAVVWTMSVVVAVPAAVNFDVGMTNDTDGNHSVHVCRLMWNSLQTSIYSLFLLVVSYLLPQVIIYVNYGRLAGYLWSRHRAVAHRATASQVVSADSRASNSRQNVNSSSSSSAAATPIARSTLRTVKMLVTISVLFLASWAPYFTIMTIEVIRILLLQHVHILCFQLFITSRTVGNVQGGLN